MNHSRRPVSGIGALANAAMRYFGSFGGRRRNISAENYEGASIFWMRRMAALGGEEAAIAHWQVKRDGTLRGIVEVIEHDS